MKRPSLSGRSSESTSSTNEQVSETIADALASNDKVVEIRPAKRSGGMGMRRLILLGAGAVGVAYWAQKSRTPRELFNKARGKGGDAASSIERGSEAAAEGIEAGSDQAGEAVKGAGETAADQMEAAGESAAEKTEDAIDEDSPSF